MCPSSACEVSVCDVGPELARTDAPVICVGLGFGAMLSGISVVPSSSVCRMRRGGAILSGFLFVSVLVGWVVGGCSSVLVFLGVGLSSMVVMSAMSFGLFW